MSTDNFSQSVNLLHSEDHVGPDNLLHSGDVSFQSNPANVNSY